MKQIAVYILSLLLSLSAMSQTSIGFHHLGKTTFQNSNINPSWIPNGQLFIGLPALSGVHVNVNNRLSYNDAFGRENGRVILDMNKVIGNLQGQNMLSSHINVSLFHLGYKSKKGTFIGLFANERLEIDFLYPRSMIEYVWNGNAEFLGEDLKISQVGLKANHFREIGVSYAFKPTRKLDIGLRGKYLIGFFDASTPHNFDATLTSNTQTFGIEARWRNAQLRTSGIDILNGNEGDLGSHLVSNANTGFAIDLGATYRISGNYSLALSATDLGFINWKEDIENHTVNDTTFNYDGVNLEDINDIRETLEDSLFNLFDKTETFESYRSWLPARASATWIYHFDQKTDIYSTASARVIQRQIKMLYGLGITRKVGNALTVSASATKLPQQFFNIGGAIAVKGGPVQFYLAADQMVNLNAADIKSLDFRLGINFLFAKKEVELEKWSPQSSQPIGIETYYFQGKKVPVKRREGVYSIIKKQKDEKPELIKPDGERKVEKRAQGSNPTFPRVNKQQKRSVSSNPFARGEYKKGRKKANKQRNKNKMPGKKARRRKVGRGF